MRAEIRNEVTRFITTMLHEASHLVNLSKDIKYSKTAIKDWDINFQPCTQLTTEDNLFISAEHFQHDSRLSTPPPIKTTERFKATTTAKGIAIGCRP